MIAPRYLKAPGNIRVLSRFHALHPCTLYSQRNFVLALARRRACVTANTRVIINDEAVIHRYKCLKTRKMRENLLLVISS